MARFTLELLWAGALATPGRRLAVVLHAVASPPPNGPLALAVSCRVMCCSRCLRFRINTSWQLFAWVEVQEGAWLHGFLGAWGSVWRPFGVALPLNSSVDAPVEGRLLPSDGQDFGDA